MKITSVKVARKFNLGNFEMQDIELTADVDENEDVNKVIQELKQRAIENSGKS